MEPLSPSCLPDTFSSIDKNCITADSATEWKNEVLPWLHVLSRQPWSALAGLFEVLNNTVVSCKCNDSSVNHPAPDTCVWGERRGGGGGWVLGLCLPEYSE